MGEFSNFYGNTVFIPGYQWFSKGPYKARSVSRLSTQELVGTFMVWNYWT
jgi:hypothetical protein